VEELRNVYNVLTGKPERKRPLGRPRHRREENIKRDRRGIGWVGVNCIHLGKDKDQWRALVNTVLNLRFRKKGENLLTS
jgi:hypothetical protein